MQQPGSENPADRTAEMGLPADAGVAGKNAEDQPSVQQQHEHGDDHLARTPRVPGRVGDLLGVPVPTTGPVREGAGWVAGALFGGGRLDCSCSLLGSSPRSVMNQD